MNTPEKEPSKSPRLLTEEEDMLVRSVEKWLDFQRRVWRQVNVILDRQIERYRRIGTALRVVIITLAAGVTTISDIQSVDRVVVTVCAGILTALTGTEAYLKFAERNADTTKQQREIEALRDRYRFEWFTKVETEPDLATRLSEAKRLLQEAPAAYNDLLTKYVIKSAEVDSPEAYVG